ncbi:MAG TPA: thiamine pyrophosphate-dependent enzyme, partial [Solirubrobacteraceae bacterium]|nr:thiamine pyrophosphate-dependent enzyme [Solirubrobacteraceae bacterium]
RRAGVHRGVLHETRDQAGLFAPVVKATFVPERPQDVAPAVAEALGLASEPPAGPVYVGVATDLLRGEAPTAATGPPPAVVPPDPAEVRRGAALLAGAQRPLIWAGGGALRAGAGEAIGALARRLAAPVLTTYGARGLLPAGHPCDVGAPPHVPEAGALWDEADVVLGVGTDFDGMTTQNWAQPAPPALVAVNVDPVDAGKNYAVDVTIVADAAAGTAALHERLGGDSADGDGSGRLGALAERLAGVRAAVAERIAADEPQAVGLLEGLDAALPADAVVFADMCIPGYWAAGFLPVPRPRRLAYPVGWGTLGFAFPAALGAALAGPPVVCLCGDGGFLFACGELATAAQERIPLTVVLVDDGGYGMLRYDQGAAGQAPFGTNLDAPDFPALAGAFGVRADAVEGFGPAFADRLAEHLAAREPTLLAVAATLKPPPTTSPRWYRKSTAAPAAPIPSTVSGGPHGRH